MFFCCALVPSTASCSLMVCVTTRQKPIPCYEMTLIIHGVKAKSVGCTVLSELVKVPIRESSAFCKLAN